MVPKLLARVWLSSPNLMPEARAHVSKVGVAMLGVIMVTIDDA